MRSILIAALVTTSLAGHLQAQSTTADSARAAELIARATQITLLKDRGKLARLYEEAGTLLPITDPRTSSAFVIAANAYYHEGMLGRAAELLERSAEAAAARGANAESAASLVQAIFVAAARHDRVKAQNLKDRALSFVVHNEMPEADRTRLLQRLTGPFVASTNR